MPSTRISAAAAVQSSERIPRPTSYDDTHSSQIHYTRSLASRNSRSLSARPYTAKSTQSNRSNQSSLKPDSITSTGHSRLPLRTENLSFPFQPQMEPPCECARRSLQRVCCAACRAKAQQACSSVLRRDKNVREKNMREREKDKCDSFT